MVKNHSLSEAPSGCKERTSDVLRTLLPSEWFLTTRSVSAALLTVHHFQLRLGIGVKVEIGAARDLTKYLLNLPAAFRQKEVL